MSDRALYSRVMAELRAGRSPEEATEAVIATASRDDLAEWVMDQTLRIAKEASRRITWEMEQAAAAATGIVRAVVEREPVSARCFFVPGEGMVEWATATAEQHLARAKMQRQHAGACISDAERHEAAANEIRQAGVSCLAEIGDASDCAKLEVPARRSTHQAVVA